MSAVVEALKDVADFVVDTVGDVVDAVSDGLSWIDDKIIQPVVNTVEKTIEAALDDPIGTIAKVGTAIFAPALLPLVNGAVAKANGASWGDAFKIAAVSYAAPAAGKFVGGAVAPALGTTAARIAAGASASVVSSTLMGGKDPLGALLSGGISAAMPILTSEIPGYDELPMAARRSINSALVAELTGKDASQAAINSVLASGIDMTNKYLQSEFGLDGGFLPRDLIRLQGDSFNPSGGSSRSGQDQQLARMRAAQFGTEDGTGGSDGAEDGTGGSDGRTDIDALIEQMGGRRSLEDLNEEELASLLGDYQTPQVQQEEEPYQGAQVNVGDVGFGDIDFGGTDFGGEFNASFGAEDLLAKPDFGGAPDSAESVPFGKAFAQARLSGDKTFNWQGGSYTTDLASPTGAKVANTVGGGRGRQGGPTAEELSSYFGGAAPAGFDSVGGGRGGQGGPTAEELASFTRGSGTAMPGGAEDTGPFIGFPGFKMNPKMGDVNQVADPRTLAAVKGFFGQAPDEQGFSVLNPDAAGIRSAGQAGFYGGIGSLLAAPLAKAAGSAGRGINSLVGGSRSPDNYAPLTPPQIGDPSRLSAFSRQFPQMLDQLPYGPQTKSTIDQAMDLMSAGDNMAAFRLVESNPATFAAMQQYAGNLGFKQVSPLPISQRLDSPAEYLMNMNNQLVRR